MPHAAPPRILFIDAYDSFTNNIVSLLETRLHVEVTVIRIDDHIDDLPAFLKPFAAVVAGPGPGDPRNEEDVGLFRELWRLAAEDVLPVLGICLGFQSLVHAFGGTIQRLPEPRHGIVRCVRSGGEGIFEGVHQVETVQYHSLHACLGHDRASDYDELWKSSTACPDLRPLAWDFDFDNIQNGHELSLDSPARVLMAVQHTSKLFYGLQFHAESICSTETARTVIDTWWRTARKWNKSTRCARPASGSNRLATSQKTYMTRKEDGAISPLRAREGRRTHDYVETALQPIYGRLDGAGPQVDRRKDSTRRRNSITPAPATGNRHSIEVSTNVVDGRDWTVPGICEVLGLSEGEAVILDSENHQREDVGTHSIIGVIDPESMRLEYNTGSSVVRCTRNGRISRVDLTRYGGDVFGYLKSFMGQYRAKCQHMEIPFWGGLMGYISYEACLETIGVNNNVNADHALRDRKPDLSFVFVERSIVIDHFREKIHVQSIKPSDNDWINQTASLLSKSFWKLQSSATYIHQLLKTLPVRIDSRISLPDKRTYKSQVRACQDHIRAGDSYELCLTTQATIKTSFKQKSWPLYRRLRNLNPSPFSAYIRLGNLTLLSSSPERFLSWSRPKRKKANSSWHNGEWSDKASICQFRPIKGTVKKQPDPNRPPLTLAQATALLSTPKERAENLMIVDLIRHDLHGVVGSGNVTVPKLMVVEEYATLFQLVSVIEGTLAFDDSGDVDEGNDDDVGDDEDDNAAFETPSHHSTTSSSSSCSVSSSPPPALYNLNPSPPSYPTYTPNKTPIDVLASSLPPGSMTGAPKLRSCQLLRALENRNRGVYSGVVGYMDIGGGGDFSVVIRSAVCWDERRGSGGDREGEGDGCSGGEVGGEDGNEDEGDTWTIGAGGAVTSLSTEEGEWEEMRAKMKSTLRLFEDSLPTR